MTIQPPLLKLRRVGCSTFNVQRSTLNFQRSTFNAQTFNDIAANKEVEA